MFMYNIILARDLNLMLSKTHNTVLKKTHSISSHYQVDSVLLVHFVFILWSFFSVVWCFICGQTGSCIRIIPDVLRDRMCHFIRIQLFLMRGNKSLYTCGHANNVISDVQYN